MTLTFLFVDQCCSTNKYLRKVLRACLGWCRKCSRMFSLLGGCCEVCPDQVTLEDPGTNGLLHPSRLAMAAEICLTQWDVSEFPNVGPTCVRGVESDTPSFTEERRLPILKILPRCRFRSHRRTNKRLSNCSRELLRISVRKPHSSKGLSGSSGKARCFTAYVGIRVSRL